MLTLSTENKAEIKSDKPWPIDLVEFITSKTDRTSDFRLSNHFKNVTVKSEYLTGLADGTVTSATFTGSAHLISIGSSKQDLDIKEAGVNMTLSGISSNIVSLILGADGEKTIQGARVYLTRGFVNEETGAIAKHPLRRWAGYIESFSIEDDYAGRIGDTIQIKLTCTSNMKQLLESKTGRYTNLPSFQADLSTDMSMEFVPALVEWAPGFFKEPPTPPAPDGKHLCTKYWEFGDVSDEVLNSDIGYRYKVDDKLYNWYSGWAKPLADSIEYESLKYYLVKPFVLAWAKSMHFKMTGEGKRSRFGETLESLGYWLSR